MSRLADYRAFWREFRETFHTTGAIMPSGRRLCKALASEVNRSSKPKRILEVGPGTGVVTTEIVRQMGNDDQLDLVEINARFADILRSRLESEWQEVSPRVRVLQMPIEELTSGEDHHYSCMISGLPLNNFSSEFVQQVLDHLMVLADEGCTLSFFEYIAVRSVKSVFSNAAERRRLKEIGKILDARFVDWEFRRQCVLANVPPAWVHHLRFAAPLTRRGEIPMVQPSTC